MRTILRRTLLTFSANLLIFSSSIEGRSYLITNQSKPTDRQLEEFVRVSEMKKHFEEGLQTGLETQIKLNPKLRPFKETLMEFYKKHVRFEPLEPEIKKIYHDGFSEEEMNQLIAFNKTRTGKKLIRFAPEAAAKVTAFTISAVKKNQHILEQMLAEKRKSFASKTVKNKSKNELSDPNK